MTTPENNDFEKVEPTASSPVRSRTKPTARGRLRGSTRRVTSASGDKWSQTKRNLRGARKGTELFLRENPVPIILGALTIGLAVGAAIYLASNSDERKGKSPLGELNWSFLSLPFLWPFVKSIRERYDDSADAVRGGVDRLRKIDMDDYTKPIRKRWQSWTN